MLDLILVKEAALGRCLQVNTRYSQHFVKANVDNTCCHVVKCKKSSACAETQDLAQVLHLCTGGEMHRLLNLDLGAV